MSTNNRRMNWPGRMARLVISVIVSSAFSSVVLPQTPQGPSWQPNKSAARIEDYAGTESCKSCHRLESKSQPKSQMGRSMIRPSERSPDHPQLSFRRGPYTYTVRLNGQASLTVEDGQQKITEPIFAIVGSGEIFQSYLVRHNGAPYRVAVDYLRSRHTLGLDNEADPAATLETAIGRRHSENYVRSCFGCHSPASVSREDIDLLRRPFGNTCEVCHGPGAKHVGAERVGMRSEAAIFNAGRLTAKEQSDFCGQCHTTASAMKAQKPQGVQGVISEPYRLEESRCWNPADNRIRCTACHDPHRPIERKTAAYDSRCFACHARTTAGRHSQGSANACPVGKSNCVSCHMPEVSVPDTPIVYADHRIRVSKGGVPFPD